MKLHLTQNTARRQSADSGEKPRLSIFWFAVLVLIASQIIFSGCNGGSSSETADTGTEDADTSLVLDDSMLWASLYGGHFYLYSGEIPNSIAYDLEETTSGEETSLWYYNVSVPTLSAFLPPDDIATGAAVIVCPGGGYYGVAAGSGAVVAEALAENGIAAFVLKYRLPNDLIMVDKSIGPLQDAQEAIKTVRERADEWGIDPARVGIMGHSAGGHLAASAGVHYDDVYIDNDENTDLRPSFMVLMSSVISMEEDITHAGSRTRLLGDDPEDALVTYFSCEFQVAEDTPPAWIAHAENDTTVMVENSELFFDEMVSNGVSGELNVYATGGHSFVTNVTSNGWMESLLYWLETEGITQSE
jgi:acetyl esterase/lipase